MGVGGHFWELLKPYARNEGPNFLRDKRVAVDLSYWIVQHDAAIRSRAPRARSPHLRTTFFRTVALFSKMGAFPVFVVDGEPSPLKAQARIERFLRGSGLDPSAVASAADSDSPVAVGKRNRLFTRYVRECVELLKLLGIPVLEARSEAEALCAQLNNEGHVDACITADSDAFLFGAKCVIKCFQSNSKEPFECYHISDIEAGLGLRRKQLVAIALLVGNDHDLHGVSGFGVDTAVRFVQLFTEDEILDRLSKIGKGNFHVQGNMSPAVEVTLPSPSDSSKTVRSPHCSNCGHPGSKRSHIKSACEYCITDGSENCYEKPTGFRCKCSTCDEERKFKEQRKQENWQIKVCKKIAAENSFPNQEIIDIYLCTSHGNYNENVGPTINWNKPNVDSLVDFLSYHQHWEPCYIRQRVLPMLSTIFLREMALNPKEGLLLNDQYEFDSVLRVKIRYSHPYYLVKWKKRAGQDTDVVADSFSSEHSMTQESEVVEVEESIDLVDEPDVPQILVDEGCWYLLTDENMELVQAAFPKVVDRFLEEKRVKELKSKKKKTYKGQVESSEEMESPKSNAVQLSITQFYRSTKSTTTTTTAATRKSTEDSENKSLEEGSSKKSRKVSPDSERPLSKNVRRRLLFG